MSADCAVAAHINQPPHQKSKFRNRKVDVDGITFDSKMEADYYRHLCILRDLGEIKTFVRQPAFLLQPKFRKNGKTYRPITYVADFGVVYKDGSKKVIDVKGLPTPVFKLKAKIYACLYDEPLICVTKTRNGWREWLP